MDVNSKAESWSSVKEKMYERTGMEDFTPPPGEERGGDDDIPSSGL